MHRPSFRPRLAASLGLGLVLATSAAGQAQGPTDQVEVPDAVAATLATGSLGVDLVFRLTGATSDGPVTLDMVATGATELGPTRRMRIQLDMTDYEAGTIELLVVEPVVYARGDVYADLLDGADWLGVDLSSSDPIVDEFRDLISGQNDSSLALYWLLGATGPAVPLREEEVRGVATQHYVLQLDLERALPLVPEDIRAVLADNIAEFRARDIEPLLAADAWVGEDGLVHRVLYRFLDAPPGVSELSVTYDFSRFGEPVDLTLPAGDEVRWLTEEPVPSA